MPWLARHTNLRTSRSPDPVLHQKVLSATVTPEERKHGPIDGRASTLIGSTALRLYHGESMFVNPVSIAFPTKLWEQSKISDPRPAGLGCYLGDHEGCDLIIKMADLNGIKCSREDWV
jgi:hypothetical protein